MQVLEVVNHRKSNGSTTNMDQKVILKNRVKIYILYLLINFFAVDVHNIKNTNVFNKHTVVYLYMSE